MGLTAYELFALGEHLSNWPEDMAYEDILNELGKGENEDIIVSEDFQYHEEDDLADRIEHFRSWLEQNFIPRTR